MSGRHPGELPSSQQQSLSPQDIPAKISEAKHILFLAKKIRARNAELRELVHQLGEAEAQMQAPQSDSSPTQK